MYSTNQRTYKLNWKMNNIWRGVVDVKRSLMDRKIIRVCFETSETGLGVLDHQMLFSKAAEFHS